MKRPLLIATLGLATLMTAACSTTTTRADLREARRDVRAANAYGDRQDRRDARRDLRQTQRNYEDDHQCGPRYGRPCYR